MIDIDHFDLLHQQQEMERIRMSHIAKVVDHWQQPIRRALNRLAQTLWSSKQVLGFIPVKSYRLRYRQADPETHLWWVERDIFPYDRYECEAYRIHLMLYTGNLPAITIQSGEALYQVDPLTLEVLETMVAKAGHDLPLIIPRLMGQVGY